MYKVHRNRELKSCNTFYSYLIYFLSIPGTTDVVPSDAALCTPCESPCEERRLNMNNSLT